MKYIMLHYISNMNEKLNSLAAQPRTAPGLTRHLMAIWLNKMLWVTNMAPQSWAAQRMLSCLLEPVTENSATWKTKWLLCWNVLYLCDVPDCHVTYFCEPLQEQQEDADACMSHEYFCKEEMIRISQRWRSPVAKYAMECFLNEVEQLHPNRGGFMELMLC